MGNNSAYVFPLLYILVIDAIRFIYSRRRIGDLNNSNDKIILSQCHNTVVVYHTKVLSRTFLKGKPVTSYL
ncbi:hypothetical protein ACQX0N_10215 [Clostridium tepidum]